MDIFKALRTAIRSEVSAKKMYERLADRVSDPEVKSLFKYLAGYEATHQQFLEAELRALAAADGDDKGKPSKLLRLLNEKLQLKDDGTTDSDLEKIRLNLSATENIAKILKEANRELLNKQVRYEQEMSIAADIQRKLLPQNLPQDTGLQIAAVNLMAGHVGGDYYDFMKDDQGQLAVVVGDSMGKGIPAALLMTTIRAVWQSWSATGFESPGQTLEMINRAVYPDLHITQAFITMFNSLYDPDSSLFRYSNAGHHPPIFRPANAMECIELSVGGTPIGMFPDPEYPSEEFNMREGDVMVIYTDGVVEATNRNDEGFGFSRLCTIVNDNYDSDPEGITNAILSEIDSYTGNSDPSDDITIVVLKKS